MLFNLQHVCLRNPSKVHSPKESEKVLTCYRVVIV
jgi:hypothetical protein